MDPSYNNSFGSFSSGGGQTPQPVMSPVGGDITLPASQPVKKKKTGLVIILVILVLGLCVVAAIFLVPNFGKGGASGGNDAIEKYKNLVLYGDENKSSSEESGIYFEVNYHKGDITSWQEYNDKLVNALDSVEKSNSELSGTVSLQKAFLKMLTKNKVMDGNEFNVFLEKYIEGKESLMNAYIEGEYGELKSVDNGYVQEYYYRIIDLSMSVLDYIGVLQEEGCTNYSLEALAECVSSEETWNNIDLIMDKSFSYVNSSDNEMAFVLPNYLQLVNEMGNKE